MVEFKHWSIEYNARTSDLFKSEVHLTASEDRRLYQEGSEIDLSKFEFYGIITNSSPGSNSNVLNITVESYARELKSNIIEKETKLRYANAIEIIETYLLPDGWEFIYPSEFDTKKINVSYILRNGTYMSHIANILQLLGLDYTVYARKIDGQLKKTVEAVYRDIPPEYTPREFVEFRDFANFSCSIDYNKLATRIIAMGADSESGTSQTWMDAEMKHWDKAARIKNIKDTQLQCPEMSDSTPYFYCFPASMDDPKVGLIESGDMLFIEDEKIKVHSVYLLKENYAIQWAIGEIDDAEVSEHFIDVASLYHNYDPGDVIVASADMNATITLRSVNKTVTLEESRNVSEYGGESTAHSIYSDVLFTAVEITPSDYIPNKGELNGGLWLGSEHVFFGSSGGSSLYTPLVRGVPACADEDCEHCGSHGIYSGCVYGYVGDGQTYACLSGFCELVESIKSTYQIEDNILECPLVFDVKSPCPASGCPKIRSDSEFSEICPKGYKQSEVVWTPKYPHQIGTIVFPKVYEHESGPHAGETLEYSEDSNINKYGVIPTQVSIIGIVNTSGLDLAAEGCLRLSSIPITGQFTHMSYNRYTIPEYLYPGQIVAIQVATQFKYDQPGEFWYPKSYFDIASSDTMPEITPEMVPYESWVEIPPGNGVWQKTKGLFMIQKVTKSYNSPPSVYFGAIGVSFESTLENVKDLVNNASQRHQNQKLCKTKVITANGYAAQVQDTKTGEKSWVRMVR